MVFQPAPNVAEFNVNQRLFGQNVQNTLFAIRNPDWDAQTLSNAVAALSVWYETQLLPFLSANISGFGIEARGLSVENGPIASFTYPTQPPGGVSSESLPGNCALCVSFRSGLAGRSARGRNYVAGIPENAVVGNTILNGFIDDVLDAYQQLPDVFAQFGAIHVVLSRRSNNLPRATAFAFAIASYTVTDPFIDSQRGRLTGRGQ